MTERSQTTLDLLRILASKLPLTADQLDRAVGDRIEKFVQERQFPNRMIALPERERCGRPTQDQIIEGVLGVPLKLPYASRSETYASLRHALSETADHLDINSRKVAYQMSFFLTAIAEQVTAGNAVRLPGFGMFAPYWYADGSPEPYAQPRFIPSRQFRLQVRDRTTASMCESATKGADNYRRSHHPSSGRDTEIGSVSSTMSDFRQRLLSQVEVAELVIP